MGITERPLSFFYAAINNQTAESANGTYFQNNSQRRTAAYAVFKPVMTWQKIQYGDLTQSGKNGQFPAVAVFVYLVL